MPDKETRNKSLKIASGAAGFRVPKTAELVAGTLRNKIIRGEYADGHVLPSESDLVVEYSISRPTLREALRILESEGLITVTRGVRGGPRVRRPDPRLAALHFGRVLQNRQTTLADIFVARRLIEPTCVRMLAEQGRSQAIKTLKLLLEQMRDNVQDVDAYSVASTRFHNALVELTGNAPLILLMATLNHIFELHVSSTTLTRKLESGGGSVANGRDLEEQEKLLACIEAKDGDGAEAISRRFLSNVEKRMRKVHDVDQVINVLG